jgi:hypothetical protein
MRLIRICAALSLLLAAPVAAQAPKAKPSPDCGDDRGVDRCAAEQQRRVRELFGVKSIEEHQAAGDQVRRAFYVDGYGRDIVAIAFVRATGRDPTLRVHFPRKEGAAAPETMQAPVPKRTWEEVLSGSRLFDRTLLPPAGGEPFICLHSWVYTIEATDPRPAGSHAPAAQPRRKTADACRGDLVQDYATALAQAALRLAPHCAALDPRQHRNEATQLAACTMLEGDRLAAAGALNRAHLLVAVNSPADAGRAQGVFDYRGFVEWDGERLGGEADRAMAAWLERTTKPTYARLSIRRVVGETADRARVEGTLNRREGEGSSERTMSAPVTLHMASQPGATDYFTVARAVVGPFKELRLR